MLTIYQVIAIFIYLSVCGAVVPLYRRFVGEGLSFYIAWLVFLGVVWGFVVFGSDIFRG